MSNLCSCMEALKPKNLTIVIFGDFNLVSIDWTNIDPTLSASDTYFGIFMKIYFKHAFSQFVSQPTRITSTSASNLDLVLCNDANFILGCNVSVPFSTGDHSVVDFNVIHNTRINSTSVSSYNFYRTN